MLESTCSRRDFLAKTGSLLFGTLALSSCAIARNSPSQHWSLPLRALDAREARGLLLFTRELFPHPDLDDAVYALVVKDLDAAAAKDESTRALIVDGMGSLDRATGGAWLGAGAERRAGVVRSLVGTPFFEKVRSTAVVSLYSNDMAYAFFGYEGVKGDGGYIGRGFNDLTWLPEPPVPDASGPEPAA